MMSFDTKKYSIWTWETPLILHWILNPVVVVNELFLGQRTPKITLIEKGGRKPLLERSFIPCPHCNTLHSSLKWTPQNNTAFRNWFGLYCDNCGKIIPCVRNLTSLLIIFLTFPIWYWFKDKWKQKWLNTQKVEFSRPLVLTQPEYKSWYIGLRYSLFMFVSTNLFNYFLFQEALTCKKILINLIIWTIGGFVFALITKKISSNQASKQSDKKIPREA